jgi:hypothetical protein
MRLAVLAVSDISFSSIAALGSWRSMLPAAIHGDVAIGTG